MIRKILTKSTAIIMVCLFLIPLAGCHKIFKSKINYEYDSDNEKWKKYNWSERNIFDNHVKSEKCYNSDNEIIYYFEYEYSNSDDSVKQHCYNKYNYECFLNTYKDNYVRFDELYTADEQFNGDDDEYHERVEYRFVDNSYKNNREKLSLYYQYESDPEFVFYFKYNSEGYKDSAIYNEDIYWERDDSGLQYHYKEKKCTFEYEFDAQDRCVKEICYFDDGSIAYHIDYAY